MREGWHNRDVGVCVRPTIERGLIAERIAALTQRRPGLLFLGMTGEQAPAAVFQPSAFPRVTCVWLALAHGDGGGGGDAQRGPSPPPPPFPY